MSVLFLLVVYLSLGTVSVAGNPCKQEWTYFGNSCYAFGETAVPWAEAEDFCRAAGGKLAEIETSDENNFLKGEAAQRNGGNYWLGGTDVFHENAWMWITTGELLLFKDWHPSQPAQEAGNEDCLVMWRDFQYQWGDLHCLTNAFFICEAEAREENVVG